MRSERLSSLRGALTMCVCDVGGPDREGFVLPAAVLGRRVDFSWVIAPSLLELARHLLLLVAQDVFFSRGQRENHKISKQAHLVLVGFNELFLKV